MNKSSLLLLLWIFGIGGSASIAHAQIINIDFLANRGSESVAPNFVGEGAAGGGTTFNGLTADDSSDSDLITAAGTDLLTASGAASTVNFSIDDIGADNLGPVSGNPNGNGIINGAYLFLNSGNNALTSTDFTISGLGSASSIDLYFYTNNNTGTNQSFTVPGGSQVTFSGSGIYTSANTIEYEDVPVTGGVVAGTFNTTGVGIYGGLSFDIPASSGVPEPSTWVLGALGMGMFLLWRFRRKGFLL